MKRNRTFSKLSIVAFGMVVGLTILMAGEPTSKRYIGQASKHHVGIVNDWTSHHLVFSNPGTYEQAIANGTYSKWLNIQYDTHFIMQQMRRTPALYGDPSPKMTTALAARVSPDAHKPPPPPPPTKKPGLNKDWSEGILTGRVQPNTYPAKWGPTYTANCATDFVAYPTGTAGSSTTASIVAYNELYGTTGSPGTGCGATTGVTVPSVYWAYNTGGTISTSPILSEDGTQLAFIQVSGTTASLVLLKWNQTNPGHTVTKVSISGTTLTAGSGAVGTFSQADVGAQITGTGIPSHDTIASVTSSTVATLATTATTETSETVTIDAEAVATPGVPPTAASGSAYQSCAAPCMYSMTLNGSPNDTFSTPYPDFAADGAVFVGDDSGKLHKFTGVFNGTPGEVTGGSPSWPVTVNSGVKITSPVYDPGTGKVFVGDAQGILHSVTAGGSINGTSSSLGDIIIDGPLVDSNAGTVYVFVTTNSAGDNAVFQFNTSFTSGIGNGAATGTEVGTGGTGYYLYVGAFDNVYYESSNHSGNLYIVGVTGGDPGLLYQIPILGIANFTSTGTPSSNSTNVTITGTAVTSADDGMQITDTTHPACIPANDTISSVSGSTVTLTTKTSSSGGCASGDALAISNMGAPVSVKISGDTGMGATDSHLAPWPSPITEFCNNGATGCALNAGGTATTSGTDYIFVSVERGGDSQATSPPCIDSESDGCIAAINVSNPSSITLSGASNFTTGSNPSAGCWWTGGIVIDNSVGSGTLAGASQVYFINLAGNSAGGAVVATSCGAAVTGNTIQAVQASQSLP